MNFERAALIAALAFSSLSPLAMPGAAAAEGVSTIVASQGGAQVTLSDIDAFVARIPEKDRAGFFNSPQRIETLINNLLLQKQLAAEARAKGIDKRANVVAEMELASEEVLARARTASLRDEVKTPDLTQLAKEDYLGHKEKYLVPGRVSVKDVFVSAKTRSDEEAKTLADKVVQEAKANPDGFDALVDKYSDDPAKAEKKGLVADAAADYNEPPFASAAKALKRVGDVSGVVRTRDGFHVLKLVERTPDKQKSFEEVKDQIVARLSAEHVDKFVKTHTDMLRNQRIDANPDLVASLRTRYGTVPVPPAVPQSAAGGH